MWLCRKKLSLFFHINYLFTSHETEDRCTSAIFVLFFIIFEKIPEHLQASNEYFVTSLSKVFPFLRADTGHAGFTASDPRNPRITSLSGKISYVIRKFLRIYRRTSGSLRTVL